MAEFKTVMTIRETVVGNFAYRLTTDAEGGTIISRTPFHDGRHRWTHATLTQTLSREGDFVRNNMASLPASVSLNDAMEFVSSLDILV